MKVLEISQSNLASEQRSSSGAEIDLILNCCRPDIDSGTAKQIKNLVHEINWENLIQIASQHLVTSLVYSRLKNICPEAIPREVLQKLQFEFRQLALKNLEITQELVTILDLFAIHNIPAISFKGPALAALAYGTTTMRQFYDLDILIRQSDLVLVKNLLIERGYKSLWQFTPEQEAAFIKTWLAYNLEREDGICVDLHWHLMPDWLSYRLDTEEIWENLELVSLAGREVLTLSAEEMLLYLCAHGNKHGWESLKWVCDIPALINTHPEIKWESVMERARELGSERSLLLGLLLSKHLLGTTLPMAMELKIKTDGLVQSLAEEARHKLLSGDKMNKFERFWFYTRVMEHKQQRLVYTWYFLQRAIAPSPTDRSWLSLPPYLSLLYYLVRPLRLVIQALSNSKSK
ncbi:MAG: nucleotidyltransferase family protein [Aphanothece sp. CMT-3BRIN-NPC111]|jgi:hypothetical protein|nr:nucleotidyltransferase family protein [Aphanothece sp. CMT-3BRIN-NPC111]